ncbi:PAP2 superfamily protein [Kytococcus aerolatus]|uniref:PAP2 superfamily protein n=1 Tax=Kytococcus aerolatus TaxID=592308 RepID=A0A212TGR8_9MICO|nr:phosphatase PAP2 family protein [Kytococcus aerolatus]SNC65016.1 PAP2 superfamily protein [Kytococcus aerolatus]
MQTVHKHPHTLAAAVAVLACTLAVAGSRLEGVPLRDPEGFLGPAYVRMPLLTLFFVGLAVLLTAAARCGFRPRRLPGAVRWVVTEEWDLGRVLHVITGTVAFYVCYVSYRNLKGQLPLVRQDVLYDQQLLDLDRSLFLGHEPAAVLHQVLGVDLAAHVLSTIYLLYMPLVPLTVAIFLACVRDRRVGAWYCTAMSLNWPLGALSYYLLPALGPVYASPTLDAALPYTGVERLQDALLANRLEFLAAPDLASSLNGVAAFASLHVSVTFAAALIIHRLGYHWLLRWAAWAFFGTTFLATLYFGWHYLSDNLAGLAIGWLSVALGARATGVHARLRTRGADAGTRAEDTRPALPEPVGVAA